jgi:hypothetical protein
MLSGCSADGPKVATPSRYTLPREGLVVCSQEATIGQRPRTLLEPVLELLRKSDEH